METVVVGEGLRGMPAELPTLRDHVRLIGVAQVNSDLGPVNTGPQAGIAQSRVKPREPAVELRSDSEAHVELPRQMLS